MKKKYAKTKMRERSKYRFLENKEIAKYLTEYCKRKWGRWRLKKLQKNMVTKKKENGSKYSNTNIIKRSIRNKKERKQNYITKDI